MTVYMAALGAGLGDAIVLLPVVQSLLNDGERVIFIARSRMQEELLALVPGIIAVVKETEFSPHTMDPNDRYIDFAAHPIMRMADKDWLQFKTIYPTTQINEFIKIICKENNIACRLESLQPLQFQFDERVFAKVIFIPGTTSDSKSWPRKYWLELAQCIGNENIVVIGKNDAIAVQQLIDAGLTWLPTPSISEALNLLSSSQIAVSVDTGLMHLCVHQGIATVSFCNHASFWRRQYHNLIQLVTTPCDLTCVEHGLKVDEERATRPSRFYQGNVWTEDDFNFCRMPEDKRCIASITPSQVVEVLSKHNLLVPA